LSLTERALTSSTWCFVSNIPLNTVAAIAGTVHAQHEASLPQTRKVQESFRLDRLTQLKERQRQEEVEDPAEDTVLAVRDGGQRQEREGKKKKSEEPEDVAELHQPDGTIAQVRSDVLQAQKGLDISA